MSKLFRDLAQFYKSPGNKQGEAYKYLVRKTAFAQIKSRTARLNEAETHLYRNAIVTKKQMKGFLGETKRFISDLFSLLELLDSEKYLPKKRQWCRRLLTINQDLPTMFQLNKKLKSLAESYRSGKIGPDILNSEIHTLCKLQIKY